MKHNHQSKEECKHEVFYTLFLGDNLWQNCTDDMNSTEDWAVSGVLWKDRKLAEDCMKDLKHPAYDIENRKNAKFRIVKVTIPICPHN